MKFHAIPLFMIACGAASLAQAACFGSGAFRQCTDEYGNSYSIQKFGTMTNMQGYNPQTGSQWSQQSQTLGRMTITNGRSADGGSWNATEQSLGNGMRSIQGTDSNGQPFSVFCTRFGCN